MRPLLVGFKYQQDQELVLGSCWRLAKDKQYSKVSVGRDLTDKQRKRERDLMVEVKTKNHNRSNDEQAKNLVYKIVGERGRRREILVPLREGEVIDQEGRVVETELRVGGGRTSWSRFNRGTNPNLEPLGPRTVFSRAVGGGPNNVRREEDSLPKQKEGVSTSPSLKVSDLVKQLEVRKE